jgi:polysaccharide deacetylase 2 family uncharacterized protein YibQ
MITGPRAAIIVDDVGVVPGTDRFLSLPAALTFAVLPFAPYAKDDALLASAAGRTVLLHLPLEAANGANPGPGVIRGAWSQEQILAQLDADLAAVPGAVGANNHMGSRGTSDEALMRILLPALQKRGMFFVDSMTPAKRKFSASGRVARSLGMQYSARDIWLDNGDSREAVEAQLRKLLMTAKKRGHAIGICHANRPYTLAALTAVLPEFAKAGIRIVPVTELLAY